MDRRQKQFRRRSVTLAIPIESDYLRLLLFLIICFFYALEYHKFYMTQQDLEKLSQLLSKEESLVRKELGDVAVKDPASGGFQPKPADYEGDVREDDIAREAMLTETNTALEQELKHRLEAILKAQQKLKTGHYGVCEKCGVDIPLERLMAVPMTPFCIKCTE